MTKKSEDEDRKYYEQCVVGYENAVKTLLVEEAGTLVTCRKVPGEAAEKLFALAGKMCDLASQYMAINAVSVAVLDNKNEAALNDARKSVYKALIYTENVVTGRADAPFSEYEKNLAELAAVGEERRFAFVRKLGLTIDLLQVAYGVDTKWRWSFVDMEGRFAIVTKNLFDLKNALANMRAGAEEQGLWTMHYRLAVQLLGVAEKRYIERFQLSTRRPEDVHMAVNCMGALKYLYGATGDRANYDLYVKKYEIWDGKLRAMLKTGHETGAV